MNINRSCLRVFYNNWYLIGKHDTFVIQFRRVHRMGTKLRYFYNKPNRVTTKIRENTMPNSLKIKSIKKRYAYSSLF